MKKILKPIKTVLSSRFIIILPVILLQLVVIFIGITKLAEYYVFVDIIFNIISLLVIGHVLSQKLNSVYKIAWIIIISFFPIIGGPLFVLLGGTSVKGQFLKKVAEVEKQTRRITKKKPEYYNDLWDKNVSAGKQARYIYNTVGYTMYKNTDTKFIETGEEFFETIIEELKNAKHHIFIEIFILQQGIMWDTILAILKVKVAEGVDVRVIYDDLGCLFTLPYKYYRELRELGIKCYVFNEFNAVMSLKHNNRDHRKIIIIDGYTCYTGGCNLADEYINAFNKFGKWKDTMIMLKGEAVEGFSLLFLQTWGAITGHNVHEKAVYPSFRPHYHHKEEFEGKGYLIPYGDSPLDYDNTSEMVYINLINAAKNYIYICTPYFVVGDELLMAITTAAKSGVDVRIITPHIADKIYVHKTTQSYYKELLNSGVRIYEYGPGFIHSKTVVSDDITATVGTVNFDYRSLFLHFECGVWMYETAAVSQVKDDFFVTLSECIEYTMDDENKVGFFEKLIRIFLKVFSPLM